MMTCPKCGSNRTRGYKPAGNPKTVIWQLACRVCKHRWTWSRADEGGCT